MPARNPRSSSRSATGFVNSVKNDRRIFFESTLEMDFIYLLEFDPLVKTYSEQPLFIKYKNGKGRSTRYYPDFQVNFTNEGTIKKGFPTCIYEVKYEEELERKKNKLKPKFDQGIAFTKLQNWGFEVITEKSIKGQHLINCKFLSQYQDENKIEPLALSLIRRKKPPREFFPRDYISTASDDPVFNLQVLAALWHFVSVGYFDLSMNESITVDTKLTLIREL